MIFKAERPKQAQAQAQGNNTHLRNTPDKLHTLSRTDKAINKQSQKSHEVLQVPNMPNNARYLGLVLFILGSWLAKVVDVFILLNCRFSRILMAVGGEAAVRLNCRCRVGEKSADFQVFSSRITLR
jgi:hypothetical protein